ncbi:MAG: T9SS type A sorting domain-containing protein [Ferruginibacter sp.]
MKVTCTLALALLCVFNNLMAQDQPCFSETFTGSTTGWTYSQGASVQTYNNPGNNCSNDLGIITPGVGGNNPCNLKTPLLTSNGGAKVKMTFDMYVMDANLKCASWKDFSCTTSMDVVYYVGTTAYQAAIDYVLPPNGPLNSTLVTVNFYVGPNLPLGTLYQIEMFFKPKSGIGNCVQQNTKYVFDNFTICDIEEVAEKGVNHTITQVKPSEVKTAGSQQIYPNPTMGATQLNILDEKSLKQICITDMYGRPVRQQSSGNLINISGLRKGFYTVEMIKSNRQRISSKLIVN